MDIALVQWPEEEQRRSLLAERRRPRLLLVEPHAEAPESSDLLEDWVRLPVADSDVRARVEGLKRRVFLLLPPAPTLDDTGTIHYLANRVSLPELQARLIEPLIDAFGTVVPREALIESAWPSGDARRNTLDVHMMRLRKRLESVGLEIRTVRSRGYLLDGLHR